MILSYNKDIDVQNKLIITINYQLRYGWKIINTKSRKKVQIKDKQMWKKRWNKCDRKIILTLSIKMKILFWKKMLKSKADHTKFSFFKKSKKFIKIAKNFENFGE